MAQRLCIICGASFTLRPQTPHSKFCSTRCRVAAHRAKKKQSQQETQPPTTIEEQSDEHDN